MKYGPDIALVGSLLGDPARANMVTALMSGRALTASELAHEAGVTVQTASSHLAKLESGGMIVQRKEGRHRYYSLSGADVAAVIEGMMGLAARAGHLRTRSGPRDPGLRQARTCYDHLAGEMGVKLFDSLKAHKLIASDAAGVTAKGAKFFAEFGIDVAALARPRRALAKPCLDWSQRTHHLAGALGGALLARIIALGWARREKGGRAVHFTPHGARMFAKTFPQPAKTEP